MDSSITRVVIVGGGTAGWMAAAALSNHLKNSPIDICLIESSEIGTVGVGEATLPGIRDFNSSLGIDEVDFIQKTQATFKLGIRFEDWREIGHSFFHPFADYGTAIGGVEFYHCWLKLRKQQRASDLSDYCFAAVLARLNRFAQPYENPPTPLAAYHYAFHFDASLYAQYLRDYSVAKGVRRIEGIVREVSLSKRSGFIEALTLDSGETLSGDLFVDCSGFRGLLIEQALQTGYEDWSHWLPCNSAIAVQSENCGPPTPYTQVTAKYAGWQWQIPLQHRVGNGYVYCDKFIDDTTAAEQLVGSTPGHVVSEPKKFSFVTGRRKRFWNKNCVALGLASGFLEPLESTSISLIQTGIAKLLTFFPWKGFNNAETNEANRLSQLEMERIRDFLVLHYNANRRNDSDFWRHCREMDIPDALQQKMSLFESRGYLLNFENESFQAASWISIYNGFGIEPGQLDVRTETLLFDGLEQQLRQMKAAIQQAVQQALPHQDFINRHCRATRM